MSKDLVVKKVEEELRLIYGEVYVPMVPDSHNEFMTEDSVRKAGHGFLSTGKVTKIDLMHNNQLTGCSVVESFIARKDDPDFIPGSWVLGVHVPDDDLWAAVKKGEIGGFSLEAAVIKVPREVELEIPEYVEGVTQKTDDHEHRFKANFSEEGEFLGGETDMVDGHFHLIRKGTTTETSQGHNHRFAFIELWMQS